MSDPLAVKDITGVDNKTILECYKKEFTEESVEKILDALRPHGKWLDTGWEYTIYRCSVCDLSVRISTNYCPNCGARMDGGSNHEQ